MALHLFSPAKLFYYAYVALVILRGVGQTSKSEFFLVSALFVGLQILHDDYWRIRLNARARKAEGMPAETPK
ncbi:MAG: hypothetical protein HY313_11990 [Acidobacteria bacterium]|nr:hypothetical protein [Acidobacteriota bacterium]